MGLADRISRVVRAELNSSKGDYEENYLSGGSALVAGGAVAGGSISKVGILAGGTDYSTGAVPLAALGASTGAARYEALRSLLEDNTSAAPAAPSVTEAGGAAIEWDLVGLRCLLQQGFDPEELLGSAINQMETDLHTVHQASISVLVGQKQLQKLYNQAQAEVKEWEQISKIALQKGAEYLAQEALSLKKMHAGLLRSLKAQLDQEPISARSLKQYLTLSETKISQAKTMRTSLKAKIAEVRLELELELELEALRDQMLAPRMLQNQAQLPKTPSATNIFQAKVTASLQDQQAVDAELEDLQRQLEQL